MYSLLRVSLYENRKSTKSQKDIFIVYEVTFKSCNHPKKELAANRLGSKIIVKKFKQ